jgi:hypothetical protein
MTTPYDAALRIAARKVDRVRRAIGDAVLDLQRIEAQHIAAERTLELECRMATTDPRLTTQHYFVRARDHRARLFAERAATHARLEDLRRRAVECYGSLSAMEGAVAQFRAAEDGKVAAAEQRAIDDVTGARYVRIGQERRAARTIVAAAATPP